MYTCLPVCERMCAWLYTCMSSPKMDVRSYPPLLSILLYKVRSVNQTLNLLVSLVVSGDPTVALKLAHEAPNHWAICPVLHLVSKHGKEGVGRAHVRLTWFIRSSHQRWLNYCNLPHTLQGGIEDPRMESFSVSLWWPGKPTFFKIFVCSLTVSYMCAMSYNV